MSLAPPRGDKMGLDQCISQINKKHEEYFENDLCPHIQQHEFDIPRLFD
jgi:hypothetical protein